MSKEIFSVLPFCPLFAGLDTKQLFNIAGFFERKRYQKGDVVLQEGQNVDALYIISQGSWDVFLPKETDIQRDHEVHLGTLSRCALVGEYSFIDRCPASASVRAIEDGELLYISRINFERVIDSNDLLGKIIYKNLLLALTVRLRTQNDEKDLMNLLDF